LPEESLANAAQFRVWLGSTVLGVMLVLAHRWQSRARPE